MLLFQHIDILLIAVYLGCVSLWVCLLRPHAVSAVQSSIRRDGDLEPTTGLHLDLNILRSLLHHVSGKKFVPLNSGAMRQDEARLGRKAFSLGPGRLDLSCDLDGVLFNVLIADKILHGFLFSFQCLFF